MSDLINLDVRTLIGALFWGNFASVIICGAYNITKLHGEGVGLLKYVDFGKLFQCLGFFLLFFRATLPELVSVNLGNSCLLVGIYFESRALLTIVKQDTFVKNVILDILCGLSVIFFNTVEFLTGAENLRVATASVGVFLILLVPIVCLLFSESSKAFFKFLGILYFLLDCMLLSRVIMNLTDPGASLYTNNSVQSLTFIVLILIMVSSMTVFYIVFQEERILAETKIATSDYLTKLLNRQTFIKKSKNRLALYTEEKQSVSLVLLSINNLKQINVNYGDNFADRVLQKIADVLTDKLRNRDLICRFSGKEFAILLPRSNGENVENIMSRILNVLSELKFSEAPELKISLSIGAACSVPNAERGLMDYVEAAYHCLKEAKNTDSLIVISDKV